MIFGRPPATSWQGRAAAGSRALHQALHIPHALAIASDSDRMMENPEPTS